MNAQDQMFELVDVVRVEPRGGYRVWVAFSDGTEGERDFADMIAEGGEMVEPLRDPAFFARVFLDDGILTWPNGFDLNSIALHMEMKERGLLRRTAAYMARAAKANGGNGARGAARLHQRHHRLFGVGQSDRNTAEEPDAHVRAERQSDRGQPVRCYPGAAEKDRRASRSPRDRTGGVKADRRHGRA